MIIQELSYRQQIARQLRTQYAEGIYRHKYYTVTLKSRLRVTQDHWKRNHWIDHIHDLVVVELFDVICAVSYSPSMVTMAVSVAISEIFSIKKWPDLEM